MANSRTYLDEMKLIIRCLRRTPEEAEEIMRRERASESLKEQILFYRETAKERATLFRNYHVLRLEKYKNEEADQAKTLTELNDEQYVRACVRFLEKATLDEEDVIPGYPGHGPEAGQGLLSNGS